MVSLGLMRVHRAVGISRKGPPALWRPRVGPGVFPDPLSPEDGLSRGAGELSARVRCDGPDSPESIIGRPDRRNQIHVAQDRIVTYGFRFREATLLIRCRADVVEVARSLK